MFQNIVNSVVSLCYGEANCIWTGNGAVFVKYASVSKTTFAVCWNGVAARTVVFFFFWKIGQTISKIRRCTPYCSFLELPFLCTCMWVAFLQ